MRRKSVITVALASALAVSTIATPVQAQSYKQVYSFPGGKPGGNPYSGLVSFHGKLFGTTARGGSKGCDCGTVFSLDIKTGKEKEIYDFKGHKDGAQPDANLIVIGGLLYGTTGRGGHAERGTVFSIDPTTRKKRVIYNFQGDKDGRGPSIGLLEVSGRLYGATYDGGVCNAGTIFSIDVASGAEKVVYAFDGGTGGLNPVGGLCEVDGALYGTTENGGTEGAGTVFSISLATGAETVLHSFENSKSDGGLPYGSLIKLGSKLYGTTLRGGTDIHGTIFEIASATGAEKVAYSFIYNGSSSSGDGTTPFGGLLNVSGKLYGITYSGGAGRFCGQFGCGTVFAFDPASQIEKVVHSFQGGADGSAPENESLINTEGALYGTTNVGGADNFGTIFAITPQ